MDSTKTTNNVREQAAKMRGPLTLFLKQHLAEYVNLVDQLRVVGWLGQAMADMAQAELIGLKLQDEAEKKAEIRVYQ